MLNIEHLLERWPRQLSGGERQRVALGRAIVRKPRLYLMDEPLSNLDAQLRVQMRREIIHLQRQLGVTTIYVTHDQVEAMTMGHRIIVFRNGKVQQIGETETIYNEPANIFVAQFIGSPAMNLFTGRLEMTAQGLSLLSDIGQFLLPGELAARIYPDGSDGGGPREVKWGIRSEDITLISDSASSPHPVALVDLVEELGSDAYISLTIGPALLVARTSPDTKPRENDQVKIQLNLNKLHLFDLKTETRILQNL
jgi:multiple sugar transport system ATP-binding protein